MRYELDPTVRRSAGGRLLAGGTPPRLVRLSEQGARALDELLSAAPNGGGTAALARALSARGTIAPLPPAPAPAIPLSTIVPVRNGGPELPRLVESLRPRGEVIVVDDRSSDGSPALAREAGATVIESAGAPGPAGARNTGLRAAATELVAFVDADCRAAVGWSDGLAAVLAADPRLAVVAPRVRGAAGSSRLARYERRRSPLDLGPAPGVVGPGQRIGYLPAAALVARRAALLELGGFDEELRFGEDVDLIWRLTKAGHLIRYVPQVEVEHQPRPTLSALLRQRRGYGSSAVALEARHPGAASPLRASPAAYLVWLAALGGGPLPGAVALALSSARAARRSPQPSSRRALAGIAVRGQGAATLQLASALSREWLPLSAAAALASRRGRRLAALALAVDLVSSGRNRGEPGLDPLTTSVLRLLDNAAYASGLWGAAIRSRAPGALLPRVGAPTRER